MSGENASPFQFTFGDYLIDELADIFIVRDGAGVRPASTLEVALAHEIESLRRKYNASLSYREAVEGLEPGTIPRV